MANMGIAADDYDGDGLIDFFVTTFKDEPRLLYRQDPPGFFVEAGDNPACTRRAGPSSAGAPSFSMPIAMESPIWSSPTVTSTIFAPRRRVSHATAVFSQHRRRPVRRAFGA